MSKLKIFFVKEHENAVLPSKAHDSDSCYDVYPIEDVTLYPGKNIVSTGLSVRLPKEYGLYIRSRSGLAAKSNITVMTGTIDPDYTGEIKVILMNSGGMITINKDKAIAQMFVEHIIPSEVAWITQEEYDKQNDRTHQRKDAGFGSTDNKK